MQLLMMNKERRLLALIKSAEHSEGQVIRPVPLLFSLFECAIALWYGPRTMLPIPRSYARCTTSRSVAGKVR